MKKLTLILALSLVCALSYAQSAGEKESFEMMKNAAAVHVQNGDYAAAQAQYDAIFKLYGKFPDFVSQVRPDYERCLREIDRQASARKESERLLFSEPFVNFQHLSEKHNITVLAGKGGQGKWQIESCPSWCTPDNEGNQLTLTAASNPEPKFRTGDVVIKMTVGGKTIKRSLPLMQVARPLESRSIRIITNPEGAQVTVGTDPTIRISPFTITVPEGETPVHIMKSDFAACDTYIVVSADDDAKIVKEYTFNLVPRFSIVNFSLKARVGKLDDKNPRLFIDERPVSLDGYYGRGGVRSFSSNEYIRLFEFYQDWNKNFLLPMDPGTYTITVKADNFEDYTTTLTLIEGQSFPLDIQMDPKQGVVRFINGRNANGAVIKDGSTPIGVISDITEINLTADDHKIYVEKENYMAEKEFYPIRVTAESQNIEINMDPLTYVDFLSEPKGAEVYVNGEFIGLTPVTGKPVRLGASVVTVSHKDYYPSTLSYDFSKLGGNEQINVRLDPIHRLAVRSDAHRGALCPTSGFSIYMARADGDSNATLVSIPGEGQDVFTDTVVEIPYGKYEYELRRFSRGPVPGFKDGLKLMGDVKRKDLAYKGVFDFHEGGSSEINVLSYSEGGNLALIGGNYYLSSSTCPVASAPGDAVTPIGDAGLMRFYIWPGFSSCLAKATFYKSDISGISSKYLMNASCIFLNGEQRVGGSVWKLVDASLMFSYSYLPKIALPGLELKLNYLDGYDIFFGLELASRIPVLNANFRFGYRTAGGNLNLYEVSDKKGGHKTYPFNYGGFQFSLGFTLGGYDCKGANILRLWYL